MFLRKKERVFRLFRSFLSIFLILMKGNALLFTLETSQQIFIQKKPQFLHFYPSGFPSKEFFQGSCVPIEVEMHHKNKNLLHYFSILSPYPKESQYAFVDNRRNPVNIEMSSNRSQIQSFCE